MNECTARPDRYIGVKESIRGAIGMAGGLHAVSGKIGDKTPRPDQVAMASEMITRLGAPPPRADDCMAHPRGTICELATGGGKTVVAMMVFRWLRDHAPGLKLAFAVARVDIVRQAAREFKAHGFKVAICCDDARKDDRKGFVSPDDADITIASIQTWVSRAKKHKTRRAPAVRLWAGFDIVCIDEAHWGHANKIMPQMLYRSVLFGLTATPFNAALRNYWHPEKVLGCSQLFLEHIGVLATARLHGPIPPDEVDLANWAHAGRFHEEDDDRFASPRISGAERKARDVAGKTMHQIAVKYICEAIRDAEHGVDSRNITGLGARRSLRKVVKTRLVEQADELAETINADEDIQAAETFRAPRHIIAAHSMNKEATEADVISIFDNVTGDQGIVICQKYTTGFDHPGIEMLVLTGKMSFTSFVQVVGRGLRAGPHKLKRMLTVVDLAGNGHEHWDRYRNRRKSPTPLLPWPPEYHESQSPAHRRKTEGDDAPPAKSLTIPEFTLYTCDPADRMDSPADATTDECPADSEKTEATEDAKAESPTPIRHEPAFVPAPIRSAAPPVPPARHDTRCADPNYVVTIVSAGRLMTAPNRLPMHRSHVLAACARFARATVSRLTRMPESTLIRGRLSAREEISLRRITEMAYRAITKSPLPPTTDGSIVGEHIMGNATARLIFSGKYQLITDRDVANAAIGIDTLLTQERGFKTRRYP